MKNYNNTTLNLFFPLTGFIQKNLRWGFHLDFAINRRSQRYAFQPLGLRSSSTFANNKESANLPLNPFYITGFSDAESSFSLIWNKRGRGAIQPCYKISLHIKDLNLLENIRAFWGGVGSIGKHGENTIQYQVRSLKELTNVIIPHFDKYPLITQKRADYELMKSAVEMMNRKEHFSTEGLQKILCIKASMNNGFSDTLQEAFSNIKPVSRPVVPLRAQIDPN